MEKRRVGRKRIILNLCLAVCLSVLGMFRGNWRLLDLCLACLIDPCSHPIGVYSTARASQLHTYLKVAFLLGHKRRPREDPLGCNSCENVPYCLITVFTKRISQPPPLQPLGCKALTSTSHISQLFAQLWFICSTETQSDISSDKCFCDTNNNLMQFAYL